MAGEVVNDVKNSSVPIFQVDPYWPKPLPNNWILGQVCGVAVDSNDNVWIIQRPRSLTDREAGAIQIPPLSECCVPAPSVIAFDPSGYVIEAWGGPQDAENLPWPEVEHGIFVDHENMVWTTFMGKTDHVVFKSTSDGHRVLTIGQLGSTGGSNHTEMLGQPADIAVDALEKEVYVADGYGNRRIIVFDTVTGIYKRHWGAYGNRPHDNELGPYDPDSEVVDSFRQPMHAVRIANDRLVYTADRVNNRIQVFRPDGTFLKEAFIATRTLAMGSVWDLEFSCDDDQTFLFVPDGTNQKIWILNRIDLEIVGFFGRGGKQAGYFGWVHSLACDSQGNIYTGEVETGKRIQRFVQIK